MIFHTVCDPIYFEQFYKDFHKSILDHCHNAKFSVYFVGQLNQGVSDFIHTNNLIFNHESTTFEDLKLRFPQEVDKDIIGYYPLCRWKSIPEVDENVCVCDVDILAINHIDHDQINNLLETYDVVNITRTKPGGGTGGMMLLCLSKRIIKQVNAFSQDLENNLKSIGISEDVKVRTFIYENFNLFELNGKMLDVSKPKLTHNGEWFLFTKGGRNSEKKKNRILNFLQQHNEV